MAIDGTYNIITKTPIGDQKGTLVFKTDGNTLTGTMEGAEITEGIVNGDEFSFKSEIRTPMGSKMKVEVKGKVEGDNISGSSKTMFGNAPFTGTRA
jgi:hypothetical protein